MKTTFMNVLGLKMRNNYRQRIKKCRIKLIMENDQNIIITPHKDISGRKLNNKSKPVEDDVDECKQLETVSHECSSCKKHSIKRRV